MNENRTGLIREDRLDDKIANSNEELEDAVFARGLGVITDMEVGYDGYLYLVSHSEGKIYRIVPNVAEEGQR